MALEEAKRPLEEGGRARLLLVGQDFGVGEPGSIVDGDVEGLPAEALAAAAAIALAAPVAGDAVADAVDPAELLGVDVDQLAGLLPLVADDWRAAGRAPRAGRARAGAAPCRPSRPAGRGGGRSPVRTGAGAAALSISASATASSRHGRGMRPRRAVAQARQRLRPGSGRATCAPSCRRHRAPTATAATVQPASRRSIISIRLRGVVLAFS